MLPKRLEDGISGKGKSKYLKVLCSSACGSVSIPRANYLGSCGQAHDVYRKIVTELDGYSGYAEETIDPRIQAAMKPAEGKNISRRKWPSLNLRRHACLSESRLMHLFTEQIGIPLRRYVLWLRLMTAVQFAVQANPSRRPRIARVFQTQHTCAARSEDVRHHPFRLGEK